MKINKPISKQPLPKEARKVFSGVIFDVYQWQQKMFDGSVETFEKLVRPDTVVVLPILDDNNILLTKQKQPGKKPFIGLAGGRVDPGEEILAAAKRELLEETGFEAQEWMLWQAQQPMSKIEWSVYVFVARNLTKVAPLSLDAGEKIELMPVSFDEFLEFAFQFDFYEPEIYKEVVLALGSESKKSQLKSFLFGKNT